jgi:hypothetical protein
MKDPGRLGLSKSIASMTADATAAAAVSHRSRFFLVMAIVLFLPVAVGFGPTFFLRPWSGARDPLGGPFPLHLIIHGSVLSAWCVLFIVQTTLVATHRVDLHRRLGVIGAGLAVAVVVASIVTMVRLVPRATASGAPAELIVGVVVGDTVLLVQFVSFVACGVYFRHRAAAHKRLMFLATNAIIGPAFSTNRPVGRALEAWLPAGLPWGLLFMALCFGALVVYDLVTRKRIHPATLFGLAMNVVTSAAIGVLLLSGAITAFVEWLR